MTSTHLPTPQGWKAELAWVADCVLVRVYLSIGSQCDFSNYLYVNITD